MSDDWLQTHEQSVAIYYLLENKEKKLACRIPRKTKSIVLHGKLRSFVGERGSTKFAYAIDLYVDGQQIEFTNFPRYTSELVYHLDGFLKCKNLESFKIYGDFPSLAALNCAFDRRLLRRVAHFTIQSDVLTDWCEIMLLKYPRNKKMINSFMAAYKWKQAHRILLNAFIALYPLNASLYVIMWICDFFPDVASIKEINKIGLLESANESTRRVITQRQRHTKNFRR